MPPILKIGTRALFAPGLRPLGDYCTFSFPCCQDDSTLPMCGSVRLPRQLFVNILSLNPVYKTLAIDTESVPCSRLLNLSAWDEGSYRLRYVGNLNWSGSTYEHTYILANSSPVGNTTYVKEVQDGTEACTLAGNSTIPYSVSFANQVTPNILNTPGTHPLVNTVLQLESGDIGGLYFCQGISHECSKPVLLERTPYALTFPCDLGLVKYGNTCVSDACVVNPVGYHSSGTTLGGSTESYAGSRWTEIYRQMYLRVHCAGGHWIPTLYTATYIALWGANSSHLFWNNESSNVFTGLGPTGCYPIKTATLNTEALTLQTFAYGNFLVNFDQFPNDSLQTSADGAFALST